MDARTSSTAGSNTYSSGSTGGNVAPPTFDQLRSRLRQATDEVNDKLRHATANGQADGAREWALTLAIVVDKLATLSAQDGTGRLLLK